MKVFAVVLAIVAVACAAADEWVPKTGAELKAIREACVEAHPLGQDVVSFMLKFEYPDEENVRKCMLCSVKKMDLFCACKGYNAARVAKQFEIDVVAIPDALDIIKNCSDSNKDDSSIDVWAYRGYKCLINSKVGESMKAFTWKLVAQEAVV